MIIPPRRKYGIVVPWMNRAVEAELPTMVMSNVQLHWTRVVPTRLPESPKDESYLEDMVNNLPQALQALDPIDLRSVIFACTSASTLEVQKVDGFDIVTTITCVIDELNHRDFTRPIIVSPYSSSLATQIEERLVSSAIRPVSSSVIPYSGELRDIPRTAIADAVPTELTHKADSILILCTALFTGDIERQLAAKSIGLPVVSSISSIAGYISRH